MSRRFLTVGVGVLLTQLAAGCNTPRAACLFPRLSALGCAGGACAAPVVPYSPVIRGPLLPRPLLLGAPLPAGPAYPVGPAYGEPGCTGCAAPPAVIGMGPKPVIVGGGPMYGTGPVYAGGVPHDSMLLPAPTVIPPGTPRVEATTEPKPMAKQ